jgi:hypothetical protein
MGIRPASNPDMEISSRKWGCWCHQKKRWNADFNTADLTGTYIGGILWDSGLGMVGSCPRRRNCCHFADDFCKRQRPSARTSRWPKAVWHWFTFSGEMGSLWYTPIEDTPTLVCNTFMINYILCNYIYYINIYIYNVFYYYFLIELMSDWVWVLPKLPVFCSNSEVCQFRPFQIGLGKPRAGRLRKRSKGWHRAF